MMIQMKVLLMFAICYCTESHMSKSNNSQVVYVKQNTNFNFQPLSIVVHFFLQKLC
jgi:hypothetical protein